MTDKELFEKLKRDGECWHEWKRDGLTSDDYIGIMCIKCKKFLPTGAEPYKNSFYGDYANPDFSTPDGFFWLWDRVWEKRMFEDFIMECEISELDSHMPVETAVPILFKHIVNPTRFPESLKKYLGD